jgi:hypothetical protein
MSSTSATLPPPAQAKASSAVEAPAINDTTTPVKQRSVPPKGPRKSVPAVSELQTAPRAPSPAKKNLTGALEALAAAPASASPAATGTTGTTAPAGPGKENKAPAKPRKPRAKKAVVAEPAVDIRTHFPVVAVRTSSRRAGAAGSESAVVAQSSDAVCDLLRREHEPGIERVMMPEKGGFGVVAQVAFPKGHFVCEYSGELIDAAEARRREKAYTEVV